MPLTGTSSVCSTDVCSGTERLDTISDTRGLFGHSMEEKVAHTVEPS